MAIGLARALVNGLFGTILLAGCSASSGSAPATGAPAPVHLANPASQHCVAKGGTLSIHKNRNGAEYGVCGFGDNRECEEWAMLRGTCPTGGIRVTGCASAAARYCAITGGQYTVTGRSNALDEQGACVLASGRRCDAGAYYDGRCER